VTPGAVRPPLLEGPPRHPDHLHRTHEAVRVEDGGVNDHVQVVVVTAGVDHPGLVDLRIPRIVLSVVGVVGAFWPIILLIVAALWAFGFMRTTGQR
jgi:hypothetical protein